jgi:OmpA-OmpF porin, OOP family
MRPAGKTALNEFATQLQGDHFRVITVTDHTDRKGCYARRGRRRPGDQAEDCPGRERTPKLIACLQPDRRADVEVTAIEVEAAP